MSLQKQVCVIASVKVRKEIRRTKPLMKFDMGTLQLKTLLVRTLNHVMVQLFALLKIFLKRISQLTTLF
jgi:hypothetical protein